MASNEIVVRSMAMLADAYPNVSFSEGAVDLWRDILSDIEDECLATALKDYISSPAAFAPSVGQLRNTAFDLMEGRDESMTGAEAWEPAGAWLMNNSKPISTMTFCMLEAVCGDPWMMSLALKEGREKIGPLRASFVKTHDAANRRRREEDRQHPTVKAVIAHLKSKQVEVEDDAQDAIAG